MQNGNNEEGDVWEGKRRRWIKMETDDNEEQDGRRIHLIHELAILCLIPWIQEVMYLYMLIKLPA